MTSNAYGPNCPICASESRDGLEARYRAVADHVIRAAEGSRAHERWVECYAADATKEAVRTALEGF